MRITLWIAIIGSLLLWKGAALGIEPKVAKTALNDDWSDLIVARLINQGCAVPSFAGVRFQRNKHGITICTWRKVDFKVALGKEHDFPVTDLPPFLTQLLNHYDVACAQDDALEALSKIESPEKRNEELARLVERAGGVGTGGFGQVGLRIEITGHGYRGAFQDAFGEVGWNEFNQWIGAYEKRATD